MTSDQEHQEKLQRLEVKLKPEQIRATLSFAGLYQMTHEMIKQAVVPAVRGFYLTGFDESGYTYDEESYKESVLSLDRSVFRASLLWLVNGDAISPAQADRLQEIYAHRHELTHELVNYIVDPDREPKVDLFLDALKILKRISRFWTQIEIDIGTFEDHGDMTADDATPVSLYVLQLCIDAYREGLPAD
ncbi:hypothetical protein LWC35_35255 [Pseudonocardia kujensis]|uniref:hypothetical protein n=1 Tax=Pseudonocardia kujensis TaxID=1128675 RepID=UPI001E4A84FA|nr:hypothetical protein [Pseudonocardia kujensis]MCE0768115.1 hypothetical protein [Pseudonocardia kujensis]